MEFRELNDEWEPIRHLLPPEARIGRPRADDGIEYDRFVHRA
jgi:hypothetical protein